MQLRWLYIIRLGPYLCRKPPTNFSDEAKILKMDITLGMDTSVCTGILGEEPVKITFKICCKRNYLDLAKMHKRDDVS